MKNVYLFQPQYAVEFRKEKNYWLPYSAGCVWSYAKQFRDITDHFQLKKLFFKREPIDQVLDQIEDPAVCGFSCYLWNERAYNPERVDRLAVLAILFNSTCRWDRREL